MKKSRKTEQIIADGAFPFSNGEILLNLLEWNFEHYKFLADEFIVPFVTGSKILTLQTKELCTHQMESNALA
jgi:hypothetical protein